MPGGQDSTQAFEQHSLQLILNFKDLSHEARDPKRFDAFRHPYQVLDDFRTSYVITFVPGSVPHPGWHPLKVDVPGKKYTIRARAGYDGGS